MTATMDFNTELITIQNELKKYIFHHQMLLVNNKSHDQNAKTKLGLYEKKIVQLCERQNIVTNNLRKERINASNLDHQLVSKSSFLVHNQPIQNQIKSKVNSFLGQGQDKQNALRSSFGNKKLLIPVSAAAATSKKTNQQILVIPMPDGGARLAATSNSSRSASNKSPFIKSSNGFASNNSMGNSLLNPSSKTTQYNNFTITSTAKPITLSANSNLKNSKTINDKSSTTSTISLPKESMTTTSLIKKKPLTQPDKDLPVICEKPAPKVDEAKAKEEFFVKLGLVTKQALSEIQNKKSERKRRTTANPQFSNAAIEAKRISAQELAAKKANRKRELAASNQDNLINASAGNKRSFLNSNRGGKQEAKRNVPKVNQKQFSQGNEIKVSSNFARCFVCAEVCDSDLDEIMFCGDCHCLFHSRHFTIPDESGRACSSTIDRIKTIGVPCPKCERKRSLVDDDDSNESNNVLKQKGHDSSNSNSSSIASKTNYRRRVENTKSSKNKGRPSDKDNKQNKKNQDIESKLAEEQYESLVRYQLLDRQVRDFRVKLALLKDKVYISKENRREMLMKKENSKRAIETIINLVKMIQDLEKSEHKENHQQNELIEKVNEIIVMQPANELIDDADEQIVTLNEIVEEFSPKKEDDEAKESSNLGLIDEASEAVNNLNALAGVAVAELNEMNNLKNSSLNQQESLVVISNMEVEVDEEQPTNNEEINSPEANSVESKMEESNVAESNVEESNVEESKIEESNVEEPNVEESKIEESNVKESNVEESKVEIPKVEDSTIVELKVEVSDELQINKNQLRDDMDQPSSEDEPPTKKLKLSPVPEHEIEIEVQEPIQVQECVNEDLDDEMSAEISSAIASIASIPT